MEKGQHIRLLLAGSIGSSYTVIGLATELTFHLSAATEDSTTKDTTDTTGAWQEFDITQRSGDIQFNALLAVEEGTGASAVDFDALQSHLDDNLIEWKLAMVSGENNRTIGKTICSGQGKLTNLQATGTVNQKATYSGTINIFGPVTVGND